jgi:hypothetical protein
MRSGVVKTRWTGMDLDMSVVRVAAIGRLANASARPVDGSRNSRQWTTYTKLPLSDTASPNGDFSIDSPTQLRRWIEQLLDVLPRTVEGYRNCVTLCLPPSWTHYEMTREGDLSLAIANCHALFQNSIFQCDAQIRVWNSSKATDQKVIVAVPYQATIEIARGIRRLGYDVAAIVPHGIAIASAAPALTTLNPICVAMINRLGGLVSTIGCGDDPDQPIGLCRHVPRPASAASNDLENVGLLDEIMPQLNSLAREISATMSYANRMNDVRGHEDKENRPVLIAGDLAATPGLDEALASQINLPVAVWRYVFAERPLSSLSPSLELIDAEAATSVSLAHLASTMPYAVGIHE